MDLSESKEYKGLLERLETLERIIKYPSQSTRIELGIKIEKLEERIKRLLQQFPYHEVAKLTDENKELKKTITGLEYQLKCAKYNTIRLSPSGMDHLKEITEELVEMFKNRSF